MLKITKMECHYEVRVPIGKTDAAERALQVFEKGCPVAQTLRGSVEFIHTWHIEEYDEEI